MSGRLRARRRRRLLAGLSAASLAVLTASVPLVLEAPSAEAGTVPKAAPLPARGATLTAATGVLRGLVFDGVTTVSTTAGNVDTVQLTSSSAALTGLRLEVPCQPVEGLGGMASTVATPADSTSTAADGFTLYARSITATIAGNTVTWTPVAPPPAQQLGDVTLSDVTVDLAVMQAPALDMPGLRQATSFCTPGRAALAAPNSTLTPSAEPSPSGSPDAAPSGSPDPTSSGSPEPAPSGSPDPTSSGSPEPAPSGSPDAAPGTSPDSTPTGATALRAGGTGR